MSYHDHRFEPDETLPLATVHIPSSLDMDSFRQFDGLRPSMLTQDMAIFYDRDSVATLSERIKLNVPAHEIRSMSVRQRGGEVLLSIEFSSLELEKTFLAHNGLDRLRAAAESLVYHSGNPFHGKPAPEAAAAPATDNNLKGYMPQPEDYGSDGRGNLKDPWASAAARHASEMQEHMAASRRMFLDERDRMWDAGEVDPNTPFRHGHPPRPPMPPRRLTDDELRRGEMPRAEAIMHRARRNAGDFPNGRLGFDEFIHAANEADRMHDQAAQQPRPMAVRLRDIRSRALKPWTDRTDKTPDSTNEPHR